MMKYTVHLLFLMFLFMGSQTKVYSVEASIHDLNFHVRAFHFVINNLTLLDLKKIVNRVKENGFNTIVVGLYNGIDVGVIQLSAKRKEKALPITDFLTFVNYARGKGLVVIPEIKLLSKQQFFLADSCADCMYNSATYDPNNPRVYQEFVFPLLKNIISLIKPQAVHIGHDELAGVNRHSRERWLSDGRDMLPSDLFVEDVIKLDNFLRKHAVETWMWGDMLLSARDFRSMYQRGGGLNGHKKGYGMALMKKLPKDIVICDWHYSDNQRGFPSLSTLQNEGFRVIGTTWKKEKTIKNFSLYAASHGANGMMATTWFHVQRKEWDVVDRIISFSGQTFLKDFPDAK